MFRAIAIVCLMFFAGCSSQPSVKPQDQAQQMQQPQIPPGTLHEVDLKKVKTLEDVKLILKVWANGLTFYERKGNLGDSAVSESIEHLYKNESEAAAKKGKK